jgi:phosphoribosylformimino-5-aminoimidazole carboxamide ribotide isomerase
VEAMILFPAIDIRNGRCVRLTKGDFTKETVFADDPSKMAKKWNSLGGEYLHVVDLDGALAGKSENILAIKKIIENVNIPVQVGGGIRTIENIDMLLGLGVSRVILGSVAAKNSEIVKEACRKFGEKIVVGIDAKNGEVAVEGWGVSAGISAVELAKKMADVGVARIIFTDIARDGMLSGVNVSATANLAEKSGIKIIASGGVSSLNDLIELKKYESKGIEGAIIGKAIYTGAIDLKEALTAVREG